MQRSGQAGIEYIILIGLLLFFFIPIVYYAFSEATTAIKMNQVNNMVNRLGKAADAVYALGPGSREIIPVTMPQGVECPPSTQCIAYGGQQILLSVQGYGGVSDIHYTTKAKLLGGLLTTPGTYFIKVETRSDGYVQIQQK